MSKEFQKIREKIDSFYRPGFDIDNTLVDSIDIAVKTYNDKYRKNGTLLTAKDIVNMDSIADFAVRDGYDFDQGKIIQETIFQFDTTILPKAEPTPFAVEFTKLLSDLGIWYPLITSRPFFYKEPTIAGIQKNFPWISTDQIFIRKDKTMYSRQYKVKMINLLGITDYYEDDPRLTKAILEGTQATVHLTHINGFEAHVVDGLGVWGDRLRLYPLEDRPSLEGPFADFIARICS